MLQAPALPGQLCDLGQVSYLSEFLGACVSSSLEIEIMISTSQTEMRISSVNGRKALSKIYGSWWRLNKITIIINSLD